MEVSLKPWMAVASVISVAGGCSTFGPGWGRLGGSPQGLPSEVTQSNVEAAQALARRMAERPGDTGERASFGFRLCLSRQPNQPELDRLVRLYEVACEQFRNAPDRATPMATDPMGPAPEGSDVVELAGWTVVGNVLLNLDETLMKR